MSTGDDSDDLSFYSSIRRDIKAGMSSPPSSASSDYSSASSCSSSFSDDGWSDDSSGCSSSSSGSSWSGSWSSSGSDETDASPSAPPSLSSWSVARVSSTDMRRNISEDEDPSSAANSPMNSPRGSFFGARAQQAQKQSKTRGFVLEEILSTEREYSASLGILVRHYMAPLQKELKEAAESKKVKPTLSEEDVQLLFCNISELLDLSYEFLNQLELRKRQSRRANRASANLTPGGRPASAGMAPLDPTVDLAGAAEESKYEVGDVISEMAEKFRCYTTYCCNYPAAERRIAELAADEKSNLSNWESRVILIPEVKLLNLQSYLIKPVQRVMKYPLLLRELLKVTDDNEERSALEDSLSKFEQVLDYINSRKRAFENELKLQDVKQRVTDWHGFELITPSRQFEYEVGFTSPKPGPPSGVLFLFSDILVITKEKGKGALKVLSRITVDKMRVVDVDAHDDHDFVIDVMNRDDEAATRITCWLAAKMDKASLMRNVKRVTANYFQANAAKINAEAEALMYLQEFKFALPDTKNLKSREALARKGATKSQSLARNLSLKKLRAEDAANPGLLARSQSDSQLPSGTGLKARLLLGEHKTALHTFAPAYFSSPTDCEACGKFIWGVTKNQQKGVQCSECGVKVHRRCTEEAETASPCTRKPPRRRHHRRRHRDQNPEGRKQHNLSEGRRHRSRRRRRRRPKEGGDTAAAPSGDAKTDEAAQKDATRHRRRKHRRREGDREATNSRRSARRKNGAEGDGGAKSEHTEESASRRHRHHRGHRSRRRKDRDAGPTEVSQP